MSRVPGASRRVLVVWCPDWPPGTPDSGPEARAFEHVVSAVEEFCPRVEVVRPGICAIGAAGPARYFGGEDPLARKITDAVTAAGFACRAGVADSLFAAELAAQAGMIVPPGKTPAFLASYPVNVLGVPELADLLPRLGIWTLADFARLPAAEAASRFGAAGRRAHRLARGLDARPLVPRQPSADLSVHADFDPPAEQAGPVVFTAKALAEQLHAGLAARGLVCVRVQVQAACEDGRDTTRWWRHDGLLSALAVAERVRWQLDSWRTGRDAGEQSRGEQSRGEQSRGEQSRGEQSRGEQSRGEQSRGEQSRGETALVGGIIRLRLVPDQLVRDEGCQLGLWGDAVISDRVVRAATRVQAMLGQAAVLRPVLAGGRDPAEQVTLVPFGDSGIPLLPAGRPWPGRIPAPAPATVYPVPRPARVADDSGGPVTVTGRAMVSAPPARLSADGGPWLTIDSWAGPWPVSERWWTSASARRRARFQLVTGDGSAWLAAVRDGGWVIEARYD